MSVPVTLVCSAALLLLAGACGQGGSDEPQSGADGVPSGNAPPVGLEGNAPGLATPGVPEIAVTPEAPATVAPEDMAEVGTPESLAPPVGPPPTLPTAVPPEPPEPPKGPEFVPPASGLRRLTVKEYQNTVEELLNITPPAADQLAPDDTLGVFKSIGAVRVALSETAVEQFEEASYRLARTLFSDTGARSALVGCEPATVEDACVGDFLGRFARRAYRRPVTDAELTGLREVSQAVAAQPEADIWTALSYSVAAVLQSPNFLYRVELGEEDPETPWRAYSNYEIATRLAYLVTATGPDEDLLDAAEAGALTTPEQIETQLDRLLQHPNAGEAALSYFAQRFRAPAVAEIDKNTDVFPDFTPELAEAMSTELELMIQDTIWDNGGSLSDLLQTRRTFVNPILAEFYGLPEPQSGNWEAVERDADDPRVGFLGAAGLLALNASKTESSAIQRGRYIFERLLCRTIPEPPQNAPAELPELDPNQPMTMRQRLEITTSPPGCSACHQFMDPLGLPLESFDGLGAHRERDHGLELDLSGKVDDVMFEGLEGMALALAEHSELQGCTVRGFYEHSFGHDITLEDRATLSDLEESFAAGGASFTSLLRALVLHDAFRLASEPIVETKLAEPEAADVEASENN